MINNIFVELICRVIVLEEEEFINWLSLSENL